MRKRITALGVGLAMAATGIAFAPTASAAPQRAAASCDGNGCTGVDPIAAGCAADAYTPAGASFSGPRGFVELRYSPTCHANWARISRSTAGTWFWVQNTDGQNQQYYVPSGYTTGYTNMVNGYPQARAGDLDNHTGWY